MAIKGFIFDLDGVITDTAEYHYQAWKALADNKGWAFDRETNEQLRGISRLDSIGVIMRENGVSLDNTEVKALAELKNDIYVKSLNEITPDDYLPGALRLLQALKSGGYKIALGSASKNSQKVLSRLQATSFFDVVADGNSVSKSKPDPAVFLFASDGLGLAPEECVVVEDAKSGVDAAISGGFKSVGIGPYERVGHADLCFPDMSFTSVPYILNHFEGSNITV